MKKTLVVIVGATLICISVADFTQVLQTEGPGPDEDWPHAEKAQHEDLDAKLLSLAGKGAVFCGHVALEQDPKAANDCALQAFRKKRAWLESSRNIATSTSALSITFCSLDSAWKAAR